MPYDPPTSAGSHALHAPSWHSQCVVELHHDGTGRPMLWCSDCRCYVSLEAVATKLAPLSTLEPWKAPA